MCGSGRVSSSLHRPASVSLKRSRDWCPSKGGWWSRTHLLEPVLDIDKPELLLARQACNSLCIGSLHVLNHVCSCWMQPLTLLLPWTCLLPCTVGALNNIVFKAILDPVHLEVHVDGGASDKFCTWALAVLWHDKCGYWYFGGYKAGHVTCDAEHDEFLGAEGLPANNAELSALSWALMVVLQFRGVSANLFYDSEFAANTTNALWRSVDGTTIAKLAVGLFHAAMVSSEIVLIHEKAHNGLPFNELVGSLCTAVGGASPFVITYVELVPVRSWVSGAISHAQWFFLLLLSGEERKQYPIVLDGTDVFFSSGASLAAHIGLPAKMVANDIDDDPGDAGHAVSRVEFFKAPLHLVQVNPGTLKAKTKFRSYIHQFTKAEVHCGGMQETRMNV